MAAERAERDLRAESYQREPTRMRASLQVFGTRDRLLRSVRLFVPLFFGGALLAVVPPHWPGLALAVIGCVGGLRRLRQDELMDAIRGPCPACRDEVDLPAPRRARFPATVRCPSCGEFAKLVA